MEGDLGGREFWLPSEFLVEQLLMEEDGENRAALPTVSSPGSGSSGSVVLSSVAESAVESTEAESDEEDILAGLTWQMAHSMLRQVNKPDSPYLDGEKTERVMSSSPQSTLCTMGIWATHDQDQRGSGGSSPSRVSSPPFTPFTRNEDALDLLSAAAGQTGRLIRNDDIYRRSGQGLLGLPNTPAASTDYIRIQPLTSYQSKSLQFQNLKQLQLRKKQAHWPWGRQPGPNPGDLANNGRSQMGRFSRPLGLSSSAWPPLQLQQQHQRRDQAGSDMRAVFLGGSVARKESSGTGVFLPRQVGSPADFGNRPACSAVLVPARVVQALNLNLQEMGPVRPQTRPSSLHKCNRGSSTARSNAHVSRPQRGRDAHMVTRQDICLPPEWTY